MCELRREHPRWGPRRIEYELGPRLPRSGAVADDGLPDPVPAGLIARARRRAGRTICAGSGRADAAVADGHRRRRLVDTVTGEVRKGKIVTGVDDHSRFCVIAQVVARATGRAVCLAFGEALSATGCRRKCSPITASSSPTGSVRAARCCSTGSAGATGSRIGSRRQLADHDREGRALPPEPAAGAARRRGTVRVNLEAQAAVDGWVAEYNTGRPHQSLDLRPPVPQPGRFKPGGPGARAAAALAARQPGSRPGAGEHADRRARDRRRSAPRGRGRAGRVRPRRPAVGEPVGRAPAVLARPPAGRPDGALLGQRRRHPPLDRRRAGQEPALAPEHRRLAGLAHTARPRPARRRCRQPRMARRSRSTARSTTAAWSRSPASRCSRPRSSADAP